MSDKTPGPVQPETEARDENTTITHETPATTSPAHTPKKSNKPLIITLVSVFGAIILWRLGLLEACLSRAR